MGEQYGFLAQHLDFIATTYARPTNIKDRVCDELLGGLNHSPSSSAYHGIIRMRGKNVVGQRRLRIVVGQRRLRIA